MSVNVRCTITVTDELYETGTKHEEIFTVFRNTSITGVFSGVPGAFIRSLIENASNGALEDGLRKLKAIKGDILFDDERPKKKSKKK